MSKQNKKTFVVNPQSNVAFEITCDNVCINREHYEFTDETGIVAFVPTSYIIASKVVVNY